MNLYIGIKMLKFVILVFSIFIFFGCSIKNQKNINYPCTFYYNTIMPQSLMKIDKNNFYIGKGFSGRLPAGAAMQMNVARSNAESDLSNSVSGYIESYINKEDFHDFRTKQTYSTYSSTVKQTSNLLVKGAETIDWLDKKNCIYWSYKIVKKESIIKLLKKQKTNYDKYSKMLYNIEQINSQTLSKTKKLHYQEKALTILESIDFEPLILSKVISKDKSKDYYYQLLAKLKNNINLEDLVIFEKNKLNLLNDKLRKLKRHRKVLKVDLDKLEQLELEAQTIHSTTLANERIYFIKQIENMRKKYWDNLEKNKQEKSLIKAENYFMYAKNESKEKRNRLKNIKKAISILESLNIDFIHNKNELLYQYREYERLLHDDVLRLIHIGMPVSEMGRKLGRPNSIIHSLLWKTTSGYQYGSYWILVRNSLVECIVENRGVGTEGAIGRYMRSCDWHMKHRRKYVVKSKYD